MTPDEAHPIFVLGTVELARGRLAEATRAACRAIDLDPTEAHHFALKGRIHVARREWADALAAADEGLALQPDDVECINVRALALTHLGRRIEAAHALRQQLSRSPEDPLTHANAGWAALHRRDYATAERHFREALRLDPTSQWARSGLRQAFEARHWFYRPVLRFFLWMAGFRGRRQALIIFGGWLFYRGALGIASGGGPAAPVAWAGCGVYLLFVLGTWFAEPVAATLLSLHPTGRLALGPAERWVVRALSVSVLLGAVALSLGMTTGPKLLVDAGIALLLTAAAAVVATRVRAGRPRRIMVAYATGVAVLGAWCTWSISETRATRTRLEPFLVEGRDLLQRLEEPPAPGEEPQVEASVPGQDKLAKWRAFEQEHPTEVRELQALLAREEGMGNALLVLAFLALVGSQLLASKVSSSVREG